MERLYNQFKGPSVWLKDGRRRPPLVVDGVRLTREQNKRFWQIAHFEATLTMKKLIKAGVIDEEDKHAQSALHYVLSVMRAPVDQKVGLAAARTVLDFCKAKPVTRAEVSISKAEEWLAAVTIDHEQTTNAIADQADAAGGAEEAAD